MKTGLQRLTNQILKKAGYRIIKEGYYPIDYFDAVKNAEGIWLKEFNINTVIDVGASNGRFAQKIRAIFPDALIYSFEPLETPYLALIKNFEKDTYFKAYNIVLSDKRGEIEFYENLYTESSSILEINDIHINAYPATAEYKKLILKSDTLDHLILDKKEPIKKNVLLKLDVQGAEMKVLNGALHLLDHVKLILTEVNFSETYKNCVLFNDLHDFLKKHGFTLCGIDNVSRNTDNGMFLQADAYFVKNNTI